MLAFFAKMHFINSRFRQAPPYKGPINGRDVRASSPPGFEWPEETHEDFAELKEYLSIMDVETRQTAQLKVYACPTCEVRVANEADMVTRPYYWPRKDVERLETRETQFSLIAVFKRTFNLVRVENDVCCYRCHAKLFDYHPRDPFILAIPMMLSQNKKTLLKREYRLLVLNQVDHIEFLGVKLIDTEFRPVPKESQRLQIVEANTQGECLKTATRKILNEIDDLVEKAADGKCLMKKTIITCTGWNKFFDDDLKDQKLKDTTTERVCTSEEIMVDWADLDKVLQPSETFDLAVFFRVGSFCSDTVLCHTGRISRHNEKLHLLPWICSGGNFLFGDVLQSLKEDLTRNLSLSGPPNRTEEAKKWKHDKMKQNLQPAFGKLILDGHFLGRWLKKTSDETPAFSPLTTPEAQIREALNGNYLYPYWLFLHDYPGSTFSGFGAENEEYAYHRRANEAHSPRSRGVEIGTSGRQARCNNLSNIFRLM